MNIGKEHKNDRKAPLHQTPVAMIVNSIQIRATDFDLREVTPLQLEVMTRGGRRTRGAALKIHVIGTWRYVLSESVDNDNEFRSRCD